MKPNHRILPGIAACLSLLLTAGCVSVPAPFQGEFPTLEPQSTTQGDVGTTVRWGGVILETRPDQVKTCFEVLSRPLSSSMRPEDADQTLGRFIACRAGFLDPEVFARGRELTLTGTVEALEERKVGDFSYQYPIVRADFISMWPERQEVIMQDYDMFYSPWYWHYPYYSYPYPYHGRPYPRSYDKGPRVDVPPDTERQKPQR